MKDIIAIILVIGIFIFGLFALIYGQDYLVCKRRYASFDTKWGVFSGCLIKVNDNWIPSGAFYVKEDILNK